MVPKKIILTALFLVLAVRPLFAGDQKLNIVASQALYADLARRIGGERVEVKSIASPKFNVHFYQPKPSHVRAVAKADLVIYTGLDLEAWWGSLVEAAGKPDLFPGGSKSVDLSSGIRLLGIPDAKLTRAEGDIHLYGNPHYAMNPENAGIMARSISKALQASDPAHAALYEENVRNFLRELELKISVWKAESSHCLGQEVIAYHDDIRYLADFLGVRSGQFLEPKPGIPPTPKHLESLENYIKENKIKALVMQTYYSPSAAQHLSEHAGVVIAVIGSNLGELEGVASIFDFYDYNIRKICEVLK